VGEVIKLEQVSADVQATLKARPSLVDFAFIYPDARGFAFTLTPEQARDFAADILAMADDAEDRGGR
jgi:HJR/Mrr/RecB family endonuclease